MKRRYYLIDTENVGDRWIDLILDLEKGDILVVFYTKNHSKLLGECYLKQRYNKQIRWVECVVGNNALDQQLTGVLSYLIATHTEAGYAIYSNDKGYISVIDFWKQRGLDIDMVGFDTEKKKDKDDKDKGGKGKDKKADPDPVSLSPARPAEKKQKAVSKADKLAAGKARASRTEVERPETDSRPEEQPGYGRLRAESLETDRSAEEQAGYSRLTADSPKTGGRTEDRLSQRIWHLDEMTEGQIIMEIAKVVPAENMSGWYVVLVSLFGQEAGRAHYIRLKDDEERKRSLSRYLLPDVHKRNVHLIAMLYQHEHLDTAMAEVAYKIVKAHNRKNKKAIRADFDKQFGKKTKQQVQYYKVVKPVLEILKG